MSVDPFKPTYAQTLQAARQNSRTAHVLSSLWRQPDRWPTGGKNMVFCGTAVEQVGRVKFGSDWTGGEVKARGRVYPFPDFRDTLGEFDHALADYAQRKARRAADENEPSQYSLFEQADKHRKLFDAAVAKWEEFTEANANALDRLVWVCNWLAEKAQDGELTTFLRLAESAERGAIYEPAPEGFWNVESVLTSRFRSAAVCIDDEEKYIFFGAESFHGALRDIRIYEPPSSFDGTYLSAHMQLMLLAIQEHEITPEAPPKVEYLKAWFQKEWRGLDPLSDRHAESMATFVRGPHRKEWQARQKRKG